MDPEKLALLVEDDPDDELLMKKALSNLSIDATIFVVRDGEEALDYMFRQGRFEGCELRAMPSLVLLDLHLPRQGGLSVLARLRQDPRTHHIPVVVFSSSAEPEEVRNCYDTGANSFLQKPLDYTVFIETLRSAIDYWLCRNQIVKV